jgi:DNA helicase IV
MVKGMEFDVVFFHNIDNTDLSEDLVKRYLYVGVSRASFYLGATFNNDCPELTKYFKMGETWK